MAGSGGPNNSNVSSVGARLAINTGAEINSRNTTTNTNSRAAVLPGIEEFYVQENGARGQAILDAFRAEIAKYEP